MLALWKRSCCCRHTRCLLSVKFKQYLDSSVKRTGTQSFCVQVTWSSALSNRSHQCWTVRRTRTHALLKLGHALWSRLRIVWVNTFTPEAFRRSLRWLGAVQRGWRRAWRAITWSWRCVVHLWWPPPMSACCCTKCLLSVPGPVYNTLTDV
jgi:hypothetical protein